MPLSLANTLGIIGPVLTCVGALIQLYDWRQAKMQGRRVAELQDYIDRLNDSIEDLRRTDTSPGFRTREGVDLGESLRLLQEGAEMANKRNKAKLRDLADQVEEASSWREKYVLVSFVLVVLGTAIWGAASFV